MLNGPDLSSRRWVWEQYDTLIQGNSLQRPGGDAGVVRVEGHETKALAFSSDVTPRYCEADPYEGGKQAVAECWRNLTATGALPLAATDNLNFGNPERPEIMGQLVAAIRGIGEACRALDFPIVSGNVSLYNETNGQGILPTPTIGGVGLIPDWSKMARIGFTGEDQPILLVGAPAGCWGSHLGQSIYMRDLHGRCDGRRRRSISTTKERPGFRARPDPRGGRGRRPRPFRRRAGGSLGRNGDGRRRRREDRPAARARRGRGILRRGPGPLPAGAAVLHLGRTLFGASGARQSWAYRRPSSALPAAMN